MTGDNRRANSSAQLVRSAEALRAARTLLDADLLVDAESRIYYAAYHAAVALLFCDGLEARSHAGVGQMLGLHFVKTGLLDADDARLFARLQKYRIDADYSIGFAATREAVAEDLAACEAFVSRVRELIARRLAAA